MASPSPPPSGSRTSCPWPFNLLLLPLTASMRRTKGVTIDACISPGKSGKSRPPVIESSKLDLMKNEDNSGDRTAGRSSCSNEQKLIPDLEACSAAAAKGTLSPMFCATGPGGGGGGETSKNVGSSGGNDNQFDTDFWEKALSAGGKESSGHHLPFIFSASDSLKVSAALKNSQNSYAVATMRPLAMGSHNNSEGAGSLLVGGIEQSSVNVKKNKKHQERYRREKEKDAIFVEKEQQQQQKQPQPDLRRPKSFQQRRKSSGASSSASSLSGRFSVAPIAPRWSLDSSASKGGGITSQSATPASLPPKAKRKSGGSNSIGGIRKGSSSMPTTRRAVIKSADMAEDMQQDALACAVRAMDEFDLDTDIAAYIKKEFDKRHGAKWHCVVGKNFGSFVTHETRGFIYLYRGQVAVLLFKAG